MDKLTEHIASLAADEEVKKASAQKEEAAMERSRVGIEYERVERLLANEDVRWWLEQLAPIVKLEREQALNLRITEMEARHHAHRYEFGAAIAGDAECGTPNDLERRKAGLTTAMKSFTLSE